MALLVVLALFDTAEIYSATRVFIKVDFPAFGGPIITTSRNFYSSGGSNLGLSFKKNYYVII
jgi:hypothetical protein